MRVFGGGSKEFIICYDGKGFIVEVTLGTSMDIIMGES